MSGIVWPNKVVFCGESRVGKTAIIRAMAGGKFSEEYTATDFAERVTIPGEQRELAHVKQINIWDLSGNSELHEQVYRYFTAADVIVLVSDVFTREFSRHLKRWYAQIYARNNRMPLPAMVLLRAKKDLGIGRMDQSVIDVIRRERKCDVYSVSALTGEGINDFVDRLFEICEERKANPPPISIMEDHRDPVCKC